MIVIYTTNEVVGLEDETHGVLLIGKQPGTYLACFNRVEISESMTRVEELLSRNWQTTPDTVCRSMMASHHTSLNSTRTGVPTGGIVIDS